MCLLRVRWIWSDGTRSIQCKCKSRCWLSGWLSGGKWYVLRTKAVYGRVGTSEAVLSQWQKDKLKLAYLFSIFLSCPYTSIFTFLLLFTHLLALFMNLKVNVLLLLFVLIPTNSCVKLITTLSNSCTPQNNTYYFYEFINLLNLFIYVTIFGKIKLFILPYLRR